MTFDSFFDYCISKKGVQETFPFDKTTLVFKVGGKMFALTDTVEFASVNLKCDPERAIDLRERFMAILPGYHMSKKHWNTVQIQSDVDDKLFIELVDHSYDLIVTSLPKKVRNEIEMG
jgi:predicted DNA-binding protein (MmcQ/YjbR family)